MTRSEGCIRRYYLAALAAWEADQGAVKVLLCWAAMNALVFLWKVRGWIGRREEELCRKRDSTSEGTARSASGSYML